MQFTKAFWKLKDLKLYIEETPHMLKIPIWDEYHQLYSSKISGLYRKRKKKYHFSASRQKTKIFIRQRKFIILHFKAAYGQHEEKRNIYILNERKSETNVLYSANVTFQV